MGIRLEKTIAVGSSDGGPLYTVVVNDPGAEISDFQFYICNVTGGVGNGNLTSAVFEGAVQSFVDSLVNSVPSFVQGTMTKTTVIETTL